MSEMTKISVLLFTCAVMAGCSSMPKSYQQAKNQADNQDPLIQAWVLAELAEFSALAIELSACFGIRHQLTAPDILLKVDLNGDVQQVLFSNSTSANDCIIDILQERTLPEPPTAPAWVPFQFNIKSPSSNTNNESQEHSYIKDIL